MTTKELYCRKNAQGKRLKTLEKLEITLKALNFTNERLSLVKLAEISGIGKTWLYEQKVIRDVCKSRISKKSLQVLFRYLENEKNIITSKYKDFSETKE